MRGKDVDDVLRIELVLLVDPRERRVPRQVVLASKGPGVPFVFRDDGLRF